MDIKFGSFSNIEIKSDRLKDLYFSREDTHLDTIYSVYNSLDFRMINDIDIVTLSLKYNFF